MREDLQYFLRATRVSHALSSMSMSKYLAYNRFEKHIGPLRQLIYTDTTDLKSMLRHMIVIVTTDIYYTSACVLCVSLHCEIPVGLQD